MKGQALDTKRPFKKTKKQQKKVFNGKHLFIFSDRNYDIKKVSLCSQQ